MIRANPTLERHVAITFPIVTYCKYSTAVLLIHYTSYRANAFYFINEQLTIYTCNLSWHVRIYLILGSHTRSAHFNL